MHARGPDPGPGQVAQPAPSPGLHEQQDTQEEADGNQQAVTLRIHDHDLNGGIEQESTPKTQHNFDRSNSSGCLPSGCPLMNE
jgi:hypothetical protein